MLSLKCNVLMSVRDTVWIKYRKAVAYWHLNGLEYNWVVRSVRMSLFSIAIERLSCHSDRPASVCWEIQEDDYRAS